MVFLLSGLLYTTAMELQAKQTSAPLRAALEGVALHDLSARELLAVTGEDRVSFLHGMVTQDVKGIHAHGVAYTALITAKGAMVSDARIWQREGELLLETEGGLAGPVKEFLEKHLISEEAEVHLRPELAVLALVGPQARAFLEAHLGASVDAPAGPFAQVGEALIAPSHLAGRPGYDLLVPRAQASTWRAALEAKGAVPLDASTYEQVRVEAGVPRFGQDMTETTIPLEANLDRALHYNKGCYIGQEVIARATFRGQMSRKLTGLVLGAGELPASGTELHREGKKVGWITSAVRSERLGQAIALAYVHRYSLDAGTQLELPGGGTATVQPLPFS
jgi:folate-binding protein YgfZ